MRTLLLVVLLVLAVAAVMYSQKEEGYDAALGPNEIRILKVGTKNMVLQDLCSQDDSLGKCKAAYAGNIKPGMWYVKVYMGTVMPWNPFRAFRASDRDKKIIDILTEAVKHYKNKYPEKKVTLYDSPLAVAKPNRQTVVRGENDNNTQKKNTGGIIHDRTPLSEEERDLLAKARKHASQFLDYVTSRYGSNAFVKSLKSGWNGNVLLATGAPFGARYIPSTKTFYINPETMLKQNSDDKLRTVILHELAHTSAANHGERWQEAFLFFIRIASDELRWKCEMTCAGCRKYGLCQNKVCPKCVWKFKYDECPKPHWTLKNEVKNLKLIAAAAR